MWRDEFYGQKFKYDPNRGYFSEQIVRKTDEVYTPVAPPDKRILYYGMLSKYTLTKKYTNTLLPIEDEDSLQQSRLQPALRWKNYSTRVAISFPIQTIKPKVQLLDVAAPGLIPREVEVERRLRQYSHKFIEDMLQEAGVETFALVPYHVQRMFLKPSELRNVYSSEFSRLPLEWFDDYDYDCMLPNDWLNLGILFNQRHPIPAEAFLPAQIPMESLQEPAACQTEKNRNKIFHWCKVSVSDYDTARRRWLVTDLQTAQMYRIPRICLMFIAEDPNNFVSRVKNALERRRNADRHIKLGLIIDSMLLTGVPTPRTDIIDKIVDLTKIVFVKKRQIDVPEKLKPLIKEVKLNYQRLLASSELYFNLRHDQINYTFLEMPQDETLHVRLPNTDKQSQIESFDESYNWLRLNTLYCLPAVIHTMNSVVVECARVSSMLFFTTTIYKTASLFDFQNTQEIASASAISYIKGLWVDNLSGQTSMCLRSVGKGWFDITMNDWTIFLFSKMYRLLEMVKHRMQNALRNLVEGSIRLWTNFLCKPCECLMHVTDDFEWNSQDLITSPFLPGTHYVFYMTLNINEDGPYYSTDPDQYEPVLLKLFDTPVFESHFVHIIDPLVMKNLVYAKLYLSSVGSADAVVADARALTVASYEKAIIPLKAYSRAYDMQCEFFYLDKQTYLREFKAANKSSQEHQDEISMHRRMKANLEATLPTSIQMGPFLVNVEPLKVHLVAKRHEFAMRVIELLIDKLRTETQEIIDQYAHIVKRLSERPLSVEHIFETREWMETLPEIIQTLEGQMRLKLFEYDILDHFWVPLPNEDFNIKWSALAGPLRCQKQITNTHEMHEEDMERFQKQQISDMGGYDEKIESLNMSVSQFSSQFDTNKTTEIAIEIKKLWKQITESMDMGRLLNKRQLLFENPPIDLTPIIQLRESFDPYRTLWVSGADFLKWEEAWVGNPLPNVDPVSIQASVDEYRAAIERSIKTFAELPKVQEVAFYFQSRIVTFQPMLNVIGWIKNPCWIINHWQEFCRTTGLEIKWSASMNFEYLHTKGIMNFYDEVRDISERATANKYILEAQQAEEERKMREEEEEAIRRKNSRKGRKLV